MQQHLMLIPSLACQAGCHYCFGPQRGCDAAMTQQTLEAVSRWLREYSNNTPLDITFHGGEPLLPGVDFYRTALPLLKKNLASHTVCFAVQSNLWLLTDELCKLFVEHEVSIGTSLDGPEDINDAQRGSGYFRKTMAGIKLARSHGLSVGCICTFTKQSADRAGEVFDFFLGEGLDFSIHAAVPAMGRADNAYALPPSKHASLLVGLLERYLDNTKKVRISTLDAMCRSVSAGKGGICTFGDCLGQYLAVDPHGWVYPCQRFAGMEAFRLGNVHDKPTTVDFENTATWRALKDRQNRIEAACGGCSHLAYCRGGCPYSALTANHGDFGDALRDPHCPAYSQTFDAISDRAMAEVFSEENLAAVVNGVSTKYGMLRKGKLLQIMRGDPHPRDVVRQARKAVAAVALGVCQTPEDALQRLEQAGVITNPSQALGSLRGLRRQLDAQSQQDLINAYIHVTSACNLACGHCYIPASGSGNGNSFLQVETIASLVRQAAEAGFAKAVITGGEPLVHPQFDSLLDVLGSLRQLVKPMQIVLRTNLVSPLTDKLVEQLLSSIDEVVVSVDGNRISHDAQRAKGSYERTVQNLRFLVNQRSHIKKIHAGTTHPVARISIATTLMPPQMEGNEGESARALGEELDVSVRFKPVLPLGRGAALAVAPAFHSSLEESDEPVVRSSQPVATCGLGMNLYVGPDGACYPCYALSTSRHYLGNAVDEGLRQVLTRNDAYREVTVNSNAQCRTCALRYLCGGYCRAWSQSNDPDSPPPDCSALYQRAQEILRMALETLEVKKESWLKAGLPQSEGHVND